mgnify:CR=1 FL=1
MTQTTDRPQHDHDEVREVDLAITGMTCASCSARIEKKLGKLDGVDAVVNLATEKATVRYAGPITVEDLLPKFPAEARAMLGIEGSCPDCQLTVGCIANLDADADVDVWTISTKDRPGASRGTPLNFVSDL